MDSENKFWLSVWALIAFTIALIVGICNTNRLLERKAAFQAGYCHTAIPGVSYEVWQKCVED